MGVDTPQHTSHHMSRPTHPKQKLFCNFTN